MIVESIISVVPVGESNALGAREISGAVGRWTRAAIASRLAILACHGKIHERKQASCRGGITFVYWREASV